jgi:threonine 3-dehydrogenase
VILKKPLWENYKLKEKTMKALVKTQPGPGLDLIEVENPRLRKDELLVEVKAIAICGTEIHFYHWDSAAANFQIQFPMILETHIPCGQCYSCHLGNGHNCQNMKLVGMHYPGAFAKYTTIPAKVAFKLPDGVSYEEGALFEPAGVAMRGIDEAKISAGDLVVVLGCGPIGLVVVQIAQVTGAAQVVAVDINDFRLNIAENFGAIALNPERDNIAQQIKKIAGRKDGADVVLEVSGAPAVFDYLFEIIRLEGRLVTIGHPTQPVTIDISKHINQKGIYFKGIFGRRIWESWEHLAVLVEHKKVNLADIITHRFPLDQYQKAFQQINKNAGKVLLIP